MMLSNIDVTAVHTTAEFALGTLAALTTSQGTKRYKYVQYDTGAGGVATVAAPFLIGLAAGWLVTRAWKAPTAVKTGVLIWVVTIVVGLVLRRFAWDEGTAGAFVIVAAVFNAFTLVGWRVIRENLGNKRGSQPSV